jgi:hypothetical protein
MADRNDTTTSSLFSLEGPKTLSQIQSTARTSFSARPTMAEGFPTATLILSHSQVGVFKTEFYFTHGPDEGVKANIERQGSGGDEQLMRNIAYVLKLCVPDEMGITNAMILQVVQACGLPHLGARPRFARYKTEQGVWTELQRGSLPLDYYAEA